MLKHLKQLGKDTVIYGIGTTLARGVSFFLLPVYTRIFTPAEYGTIEMLTIITSFLSTITMMGMNSAQSMFFFREAKKGIKKQAQLVSAILQWRLIYGSSLVLVATLLSPLLNNLLFKGDLKWEYFAIAFLGCLLSQIMNQSAEIFRLIYRPWGYIGLTLSQSLISASSILILILVFNRGILGFLMGTTLSFGIVAMIGWLGVRNYLDFGQLHLNWWPELFRFGAPLVVDSMGSYLMFASDRWFLQFYHGSDTLGVYAVSTKFAMLFGLLIEIFRRAWWPIAMELMQDENGPNTYRFISRIYTAFASAGVIGITFLAPWLVGWFAGPDYQKAFRIIGILTWQSLFYGLYMIVALGIWKAEKTYITAGVMSGAALLNILFNFLLVPSLAGLGAALSTSVTFFLWIIISALISMRLWDIHLPFKVMAFQVGLGVLVVFLFTTINFFWPYQLAITFCSLSILIFSALRVSEWRNLLQHKMFAKFKVNV